MFQPDNQKTGWFTCLIDLGKGFFQTQIQVGPVIETGQRIAPGKSVQTLVLRAAFVDQAQNAIGLVRHTVTARIPATGILHPKATLSELIKYTP